MSLKHQKIRTGLLVKGVTVDPSDAEEGDLIFRSDLFKYRIYRNGNWANLLDSRLIQVNTTTDSTTTGAHATIPSTPTPWLRLTNASLASIDGITAVGDGTIVTVSNITGFPITIFDETGGTLANRIKTGNAKPLKMKNDASITLIYDGTSSRWRVISGIGSGTGDTTDLLERLKDTLADSSFGLVTPLVVATQEDTLTDVPNTTATYDLVNSGYTFTVGQKLTTLQLADSNEFLNNTNALQYVALSAFWKIDSLDTAATYEVSRNGGNEWQAITMSRVGLTDSFYGTHTFTDESVNQTLSSLAVVTSAFDLNITTQQEIGQAFTLTNKCLLKSVVLQLAKTGTPSGSFYVQLIKNSAGSPSTISGDVLAESNAIPLSSVSAGNSSLTVTLPQTYLTAGTYHLVVRTDAAYKASFNAGTTKLQWRGNASAPTPYMNIYNGVWSVSTGNQIAYSLNGISIDLRVRVTAGASNVELYGLGLFYELDPNGANTGLKNREVFTFSGSLNTTAFVLTKFVPDADLLKVYDVNTGQVYTYGTWTLSGSTVNFTSGQFFDPGNTITLVFDQVVGNSFDSSDLNGLLLASNFLGSADPNIDRSANGRGIFLRRPDGTLREVTIDNSDNIVVYSV